MTAKELIEEIKKCPQDEPVKVKYFQGIATDYCWRYKDIESVQAKTKPDDVSSLITI